MILLLAGIFDAFFRNPPDASQRFSRGIIHSTEAGEFVNGADIFSVLFRPLCICNRVRRFCSRVFIRFWFAETLSFRAGRKQTVLLSQIDMI